MIRGIEVEFSNSDESLLFLRDVAKHLDVYDKIYISLIDMLYNPIDNDIICSKDKLEQLLDQIFQLLFLELFVFPNEKTTHTKIIDYSDFLNSDCKMAVLCSDSAYFDIYIKDEKTIADIYDCCKARCCTNLEIKTDETDGRTCFSVL